MLSRSFRIARFSASRPVTPLLVPLAARSLGSPWTRGLAKNNRPHKSVGDSGSSGHSSPPTAQNNSPKASTPAQKSPESGQAQPNQSEPASEGLKGRPEAAWRSQPSRSTPFSTSDRDFDGHGSNDKRTPFDSLPDLTQGIPSTLEYETSGATNRSALASITETEHAGRGKGELPASAYVSSSERRRKRLAAWMLGSFAAFTVGGVVYLGRNWDKDEIESHRDVPNGWGLGLWWNRSATRMKEWTTYYQEPAFEKLLPDPDASFERPYTLCLSLEDLLVHSEWTREHGWRVAKRPGVDYFLRYLSQYYELVLFTTVPFSFGEPLVRKLDPYRIIMWPLFREATKYKDGAVVKDLSYLNRDLSKVIVIDTNAPHVRAQPENAIILPKWTGDTQDTDLVALIPFLEYIHTMQYGDVRKVLKSFDGKHIPTEFARREAIARAEFQKQQEMKRGTSKGKSGSGVGFLGNMLGLKPSSVNMMVSPDEQNASEAYAQGKMLQDLARERGQKNYEFLEREIRENGEKWLKEEAAMMEKANKEAMNSMMSSFTGWFVPPSTREEPKKEGDSR